MFFVALLAGNHDHHALARRWFAGVRRAKLAFAVMCSLGDPIADESRGDEEQCDLWVRGVRILHELIDLTNGWNS